MLISLPETKMNLDKFIVLKLLGKKNRQFKQNFTQISSEE